MRAPQLPCYDRDYRMIATTWAGAADAPTSLSGNTATSNPCGGRAPRLVSCSMPIWTSLAHAMGLPEQRAVTRRSRFADLGLDRKVPVPLIYPHHRDATIEQPFSRCRAHARADLPELLRPQEAVAPCPDEHDGLIGQTCSRLRKGRFHVRHRDWVIVGFVRHIEHYTRADTPLERDVFDGLRRLASRNWSIVPRRVLFPPWRRTRQGEPRLSVWCTREHPAHCSLIPTFYLSALGFFSTARS